MNYGPDRLLNDAPDVSEPFGKMGHTHFLAMKLAEFDAPSGRGRLKWQRFTGSMGMSFNQAGVGLGQSGGCEFPGAEYDASEFPMEVSFVSPRVVRVRIAARERALGEGDSLGPDGVVKRNGTSAGAEAVPEQLMLAGPVARDSSWESEKTDRGVVYRSAEGEVEIQFDPWHIIVRDSAGKVLTRTHHLADGMGFNTAFPMPFGFVRKSDDLARWICATFAIAPDEKFFGCGESFTRLNKRGQKMHIFNRDANGTQTAAMYKSIPFFLSSRGYGMFVHSSVPMTFDFGHTSDQVNQLYVGDDQLDLFIFIGSPKEVLAEYTAVTGRASMPPLWSFGLWMSRITYFSEEEVRAVAAKLRERLVPCDVIHIDTGWFDEDWRCDYQFSPKRFVDPAKMMADLKQEGFRISLWQLPYFSPKNRLWKEIVDGGFAVRGRDGGLPTEDAIIDFSNPAGEKWFLSKIEALLRMGVGAIKVDFGEAAPLHGQYASGRSGWHEHNLYALRYNRAISELTKKTRGESIIWARSAWAGSQRYPTHWAGDAENTDTAMAGTLRAGLSLGLCGFSFWSHDIGGFIKKSPAALYRRWMPFGMLTSHSRCHGQAPKEPWEFGGLFEADFRRAVELKYRLMPYVYAQAQASCAAGWPMLRALFFEYPDDPTSWLVDDEYLFGSDLLVAPMFEESAERMVYLPPGAWVDYQTGHAYEGGRWHRIAAGEIPVVLLARTGAAIPHAAVAQHTGAIDWGNLELMVFADEHGAAEGLVGVPGGRVQRVRVEKGRVLGGAAGVKWRLGSGVR